MSADSCSPFVANFRPQSGHESAANQNKDFRCGQQWTARFASLDHPTSSHPLSSAALEEFATALFEDDDDPVLLA
jgi:hypothetical protein